MTSFFIVHLFNSKAFNLFTFILDRRQSLCQTNLAITPSISTVHTNNAATTFPRKLRSKHQTDHSDKHYRFCNILLK